jgi:hypothetical protein
MPGLIGPQEEKDGVQEETEEGKIVGHGKDDLLLGGGKDQIVESR